VAPFYTAIWSLFTLRLTEASVAVLYAVFVVIRAARRPSIPADQQEKYVPLPDVTPIVMGLDPRTDPDGEDELGS